MQTAAQIRQEFFDFFKSKGHLIVSSAPIVIKNDPTLMFTNAGMNPFKDVFLGNREPQHTRIADTQKCLRVSGKHNDLEEVGIDTYHHTMFEMLGNWSFGDYFKTEAIAWAWELLTEVYKLDKNRLYVTIFEGDSKENLERDNEAYNEWKKWISEDRILLGNKKDNFWEMGDTGPCGPCSEIHCDIRPDFDRLQTDGKDLVNASHPQVIEIWNLVFMQFNRKADSSLEPLPAKHVDTGMGFERLVRVLQGKSSNYDTDVFQPLIQFVEGKTHIKYGTVENTDIAMRVLSDHIRAVSFTIADGQLPSNTGAGYVIRRILRRAVRYYYSYLNYDKPLLHELMYVLAEQLKDVFSELYAQKDFVSKVILEEEQAFLRTLDSGLKKIDKMQDEWAASKTVDGHTAFELYDTFGFPLDLTELISREKGYTVDTDGFNKEMQEQKTRSRAAGAVESGDWITVHEVNQGRFVGYDSVEVKTQVLKYREQKTKNKTILQMVLAETPFYAEMGGQVGDTGILQFDTETIKVLDTKKENDLFIHFIDKLPKALDTSVTAIVNNNRRADIRANHSATHLLHSALRLVLGKHVQQKGSYLDDNTLRFDFVHFSKMTDEELKRVEDIVNDKIRANIPVVTKELPKEEAMKLGAMALFGEKYGDIVRVVIIDPAYSVELCGGTHVGYTGEIGLFKITSESAVAAGVRRLEAVTGNGAMKVVSEAFETIAQLKERITNPKGIVAGVDKLMDENTQLKKQVEQLTYKQIAAIKDQLKTKVELINGVSFISAQVDLDTTDAIKKLCYDLKNEIPYLLAAIGAQTGEKVNLSLYIDEILVKEKNWDARILIKEVAQYIKGSGGGQPFFASAGGTDISELDKAFSVIKSKLS